MNPPRILTSSKYQAALLGTILTTIPLLWTLTDPNLSRDQKRVATEHAVYVMAGLWVAGIGGTSLEDYARLRDQPSPPTPPDPPKDQ